MVPRISAAPELLLSGLELFVGSARHNSDDRPRLRAIFNRGSRSQSGAVGAAEEPSTNFRPMPDDFAAAVFADRRYAMNCAFEAIENMPGARRDKLETLVVIISADFALGH